MAEKPLEPVAFARLGQTGARSPLVIAVPHAGRHYPPALMGMSRLPLEALESIEDRHADLLVTDAVKAGAVAIVARMARAYVDLNRDEREIDPAILTDRPEPGVMMVTPKVTGGLGVIPSRIAAGGRVWKRPLTAEEVTERIATVHRPYHLAIAQALDAARARHGLAVLIDCHSMPSLGTVPASPRIIVGDRHGRSAGLRFVQSAVEAAKRSGRGVARNQPYAGGYTLDRHGKPNMGIHALQIEIDRTLYLDTAQRAPGPGLTNTRSVFARICAALEDEARGFALAAE